MNTGADVKKNLLGMARLIGVRCRLALRLLRRENSTMTLMVIPKDYSVICRVPVRFKPDADSKTGTIDAFGGCEVYE